LLCARVTLRSHARRALPAVVDRVDPATQQRDRLHADRWPPARPRQAYTRRVWQTKLDVRRVIRSPVMTFRKDELVLGGDEWADIDLIITEGEHATLRVDDDGSVWVTDRGRDLGTHVNGVRISEPTKLALDDVVSFTTDGIDIGTSYVQLAAAPVKSPVEHCNWQIEVSTRYAYPAVQHVVRGDEIVIGRELPARLVLEGEDIAPRHCVLKIGSHIEVMDLGSELGTLVNGVPITRPTLLAPTDELELAEYSVRVVESIHVDEPVWEATFEVHARGHVPSTMTFRKPEISIGRVAENDIVLPNSRQVSKRHCTLHVGEHIEIEDTGSTNGTWMNGKRLHDPAPLTTHDRLYVGDYVIMLLEPPKRVR
jgi:pSer/pThr/pTyr-binding forkhead associated (FHA) protein